MVARFPEQQDSQCLLATETGQIILAVSAVSGLHRNHASTLHPDPRNVPVIAEVTELLKPVLNAVRGVHVKRDGSVQVQQQGVEGLADGEGADAVLDAEGLCAAHRCQVECTLRTRRPRMSDALKPLQKQRLFVNAVCSSTVGWHVLGLQVRALWLEQQLAQASCMQGRRKS